MIIRDPRVQSEKPPCRDRGIHGVPDVRPRCVSRHLVRIYRFSVVRLGHTTAEPGGVIPTRNCPAVKSGDAAGAAVPAAAAAAAAYCRQMAGSGRSAAPARQDSRRKTRGNARLSREKRRKPATDGPAEPAPSSPILHDATGQSRRSAKTAGRCHRRA